MRLGFFGSTGRVGNVVLQNALQDGWNIKALVRNPEEYKEDSSLIKVIKGNALEEDSVFETIRDTDAVFSALGTDGNTTLSESIPLIIKGMQNYGVKRIVTIGTAGILQSRAEAGLYRFQSSESKRKLTRAAEEHLKVYSQLKETDLSWTILCPTYLPDGERIGKYRTEQDYLPIDGKMISVYDTGDYAYSLLQTGEYPCARVGICY
ncbi:NAD(P)-dependent oxidoreductase [Falsibacillus pallidus]|uniref:Putative NADH-flavin reductase n=1 Tax=Falsibacillus pallidus TaxID=493781 RepID=A0A370GZ23_9BACI|nr:NAD(P)H-binding protein [Falsibacillus pallidus]RDI47904.1 putative NADH-flavin reductase [Falsibacillus pallidus]